MSRNLFSPCCVGILLWLATATADTAAAGVLFEARMEYPLDLGDKPVSIVMGDVNGDGILDLAAADQAGYGDDSASVFLGNGDGTFQSPVSYGVGRLPSSIAAADLNADGALDLVTANSDDYQGNDVSVLLGNGDGTFQSAVGYGAGERPSFVATGDLDGDGALDLVVTNSDYQLGSDISVLLGNGDGTFQSAVNYAVGLMPEAIAIEDVDGDGAPDLAVANNSDDDVSVLLGNGDGTFQTAVDYGVGDGPYSVFAGDLNGDGAADLAIANRNDDDVAVLLGNGDGTFQGAVDYEVGDAPRSIAAGDLNGDDALDLAVADVTDDTVSVLLGNGDGSFQSGGAFGVGDVPVSIALGDLDGDGALDLASAHSGGSGEVSVLLGSGDGAFLTAVDYALPVVYPEMVVAGDLNGDGAPDLAVVTEKWNWEDYAWVLLNNGDGTFQGPVEYAVGEGPFGIDTGDLNDDGALDLVVANYEGDDVSVLLGNGDGTFQSAVGYPVGEDPWSIAMGDLDGDDALDLAVSSLSGDVSVLLGNGDGTFGSAVAYGVGGRLFSVAVEDLDGDGALDLVVPDYDGDDVSVLLGNGDGTFRNAAAYGAGNAPRGVATADLDGDGAPDLVVSSGWVLLGNGDGTFQSAVAHGGGASLGSPAIGDLDGDGALDLAVDSGSWTGSSVSVLLGDGDGTFQNPLRYGVGLGPLWVVAADLNGNGAPDLTVSNHNSFDVSVLLNRRIVRECLDGIDNDGDGLTDYPDDPGCAYDSDLWERHPTLPCDDGLDNDGDGRTDFDPATFASPGDQYTLPLGTGDPGCRDPSWSTESPHCQDGINNDPGQDPSPGRIDFDAGYSANGSPHPNGPDPQCVGKPWKKSERSPPGLGCGLGSELALLLPAFLWLWGRRRR